MDRFTGGFSSDSTWTIHDDYDLFGTSDTRDNSILSEFGWNFQQPPPEFDRVDYGGCCGVPEETNPTTSAVAVQSQAGSVENTGDVSVSNPLVSSSSFEDRPETSAASGDAASSGKPPSSETGSIMKPIQPPAPNHKKTPRRGPRPQLSLPLPERQPHHVALPLPLPPSSSLNFSQLDRINRIGSGSGGTVYKVLHRPTATLFALKVIYGTHDDDVRRQIRREIEILRGVDNLNVVKCHDMSDHAGEIQVLLEYMDRGSLEGMHMSNEASLADLSRQILSGLYYLHGRKIVHRDIKPSNLLINSKKQVKIADFGVSTILAQTMDPCNSAVGTIAYMSPERINTDLNQGRYDGCAGDIWSVGVSILEFYMGRFPFASVRGGDWASLMCAICMSQPPEAPATASHQFRHFISCCLQMDPARRWTAAQLLRHPFVTGARSVRHYDDEVQYPTYQLLPPPPHLSASSTT
ncbi:hypothetical protein L6452_33328 [Arctium lappa]|uniref:Uncharacterized protein n=1 Tax=Arctium lappa TaxID=4217 RepID=A0ACB8YFQ6_ARCLA|nr:hypothetical protein L6452_33328 [Arctium lappa]